MKIVPKLPSEQKGPAPLEGHSHIHSDFGDKKITMCKHIRFEQGIISGTLMACSSIHPRDAGWDEKNGKLHEVFN
jgi:hypothetical protein